MLEVTCDPSRIRMIFFELDQTFQSSLAVCSDRDGLVDSFHGNQIHFFCVNISTYSLSNTLRSCVRIVVAAALEAASG
jgi:hypothetical protein